MSLTSVNLGKPYKVNFKGGVRVPHGPPWTLHWIRHCKEVCSSHGPKRMLVFRSTIPALEHMFAPFFTFSFPTGMDSYHTENGGDPSDKDTSF